MCTAEAAMADKFARVILWKYLCLPFNSDVQRYTYFYNDVMVTLYNTLRDFPFNLLRNVIFKDNEIKMYY